MRRLRLRLRLLTRLFLRRREGDVAQDELHELLLGRHGPVRLYPCLPECFPGLRLGQIETGTIEPFEPDIV